MLENEMQQLKQSCSERIITGEGGGGVVKMGLGANAPESVLQTAPSVCSKMLYFTLMSQWCPILPYILHNIFVKYVIVSLS